jgi:hypothetical protein
VVFQNRPWTLVAIVVYKAVWGMSELFAGAFVHKVPAILRAQLAADPQDQLAGWLLAHTPVRREHLWAISAGLVALGLLKVALAAGIWYRSWAVRDAALVLMAAASVFTVGAVLVHFSTLRLVLLGLDLLIVLYIWRYLPRHLPPRPPRQRRVAVLP